MNELKARAVRLGLMVTLLVLGVVVTATPAHAITFNFTSDHCTGGCGTPPFGTVVVTQNGLNVDIVVTLAAGYSFVKSGAGDFQNFKFNATGVSLSDITIDAHIPALVAATGAFNGNGTGTFSFGINCPSCANGGAGDFSAPISFHIANATIAEVTAPNPSGNIFVADVLAPNENTGPIDVSAAVTTPEPASLTLLGLGLFGTGVILRRKKSP